MPSLTCFTLRFTPSWGMIFLSTFMIALFLRLGFWQLHRAYEKESLVQAHGLQQKKNATQFIGNQQALVQYQKIALSGHFLRPHFLLDNQHYKHQFGYNVLSPLALSNGYTVLIDRGWVPSGNTRQTFPPISTARENVQLQGTVYFPSASQWVLGQNVERKNNHITVIEKIDTDSISHILQKKVYPFIIRLDKDQAHGFVREWATVAMPPQRHNGYAMQWFAMAFIILILFVALNVKKTA